MLEDKYFTLNFDRYYQETVDSFVDNIEDILYKWKEDLRLALSDNLPMYLKGKLRQPRSRLFPYMVTGELKDSVNYDIDTHRGSKSTVINIEAEIGSNHGRFGREDGIPSNRGELPSERLR